MIKNRTKDYCVKCGAVIFYDDEDGYWDHLRKENGTNSTSCYVPCCDDDFREFHEPTNYIRDANGQYHRRKKKLRFKIKKVNAFGIALGFVDRKVIVIIACFEIWISRRNK